jgi:DNA-directed RNA polymerase subunit RPC12/RpoP
VVSYIAVGALTAAMAYWTAAGSVQLMVVAGVGLAACSAYAYYLLRRYRVQCPDCKWEGAHFARDTQNRQLLMCPHCGYRAPTGRRVLADSPVGH